MGPLAGIMCSDYYLVRKEKFNIGELYKPNGLYWYDHGYNWRAFVAFLYAVTFFVCTDGNGLINPYFQCSRIRPPSWSCIFHCSGQS
jgi:Cytosine/uracil/thiamine/allantoin permeases